MSSTDDKPKNSAKSIGDLIGNLQASWQPEKTIPAPNINAPLNPSSTITTADPRQIVTPIDIDQSSYYDFDLAEFPWAIFSRSDRPQQKEPLVYTDTIKHPDTGETIPRVFKTYPSPWGFPTATTFELAYVLMQMYIEQGATDDKIVFGSLRRLAKSRGLQGSGADLKRIKRDLDILGSMSITSENAFWNAKLQCYESIRQWRFFGEAHYFMPKPRFEAQEELPFGYIEVTPTFRRIAKTRGFFALGFPKEFFFRLKPLEQRLAIFLARRFRLHSFVRRRVSDLANTIPITVAREDNQRQKIRVHC